MKFLIDAQLPYKLALFFKGRGFDVIHTDDLPNKERTSDKEIREIAQKENRILITKDNDFFESYIISKSPSKLLLISTGNIVNNKLLELFDKYLLTIIKYFETHNFQELTNTDLYAHE